MILDNHIHIYTGEVNQEGLSQRFRKAGVDGGVLISLTPLPFVDKTAHLTSEERVDNALAWCKGKETWFPFFWLDPTTESALEDVSMAVEKGMLGFKIICTGFSPGDDRVMKVYAAIAEAKKPILFHSGILWDGAPSSQSNRPAEFEALLEINGLKFCLAHISWPWCDECIAVYGKFLNSYQRRPDLSVEMFIDISPGTPEVYRKEVFAKLFGVGYEVETNVLFGSDSSANDYGVDWVKKWIKSDQALMKELNVPQLGIDDMHEENLRRFLGISNRQIQKKALNPAE